ncbi:MAG: N-acetyltransferase [Hyphomicrobiales bacterium]|nr:MAG: N-acetyltransferase [Hyphomicrobiales bacterium]
MSAPQPARRPERLVLEGRYARLEPLAAAHADALFAAAVPERFTYLAEPGPADAGAMAQWVANAAQKTDPLYFAVIDKASGRAEGRQSLMRITPEHGVIEIGGIYWGPAIARGRVTTEALFLHACYIFDELGYRRFEWKCNDLNEPSKAAARRFGFTFEGVFRQHMIVKGQNRDTAWFAMLDSEWPALKARFERWLDPTNFDAAGRQLNGLGK